MVCVHLPIELPNIGKFKDFLKNEPNYHFLECNDGNSRLGKNRAA